MKEVCSESREAAAAGAAVSTSPCAACKLLRRRCTRECLFAPHFPPHEPHKFANVHKVFGASNVNKLLQELPAPQRSDAVSSMVYEANARVRDPVYGCVGAISSLQQHIDVLQAQLAITRAETVHMRMRHAAQLARLGGHSPIHSITGSGSPSSPSSPGGHYNIINCPVELQDHAKSLLGLDMDMDMLLDQTNIVDQLMMWSC